MRRLPSPLLHHPTLLPARGFV
uniref:Uncharacterized protein n=1 Tax=Arundo donax TaxID=35708 RepID=A0A0A9H191_ARUDO